MSKSGNWFLILCLTVVIVAALGALVCASPAILVGYIAHQLIHKKRAKSKGSEKRPLSFLEQMKADILKNTEDGSDKL